MDAAAVEVFKNRRRVGKVLLLFCGILLLVFLRAKQKFHRDFSLQKNQYQFRLSRESARLRALFQVSSQNYVLFYLKTEFSPALSRSF